MISNNPNGRHSFPPRHRYCLINSQITQAMNVKRLFGTILTILGIVGIIYAGYGFIQQSMQWRQLLVAAVIGVIFFISGIGLVRNTKDEA